MSKTRDMPTYFVAIYDEDRRFPLHSPQIPGFATEFGTGPLYSALNRWYPATAPQPSFPD